MYCIFNNFKIPFRNSAAHKMILLNKAMFPQAIYAIHTYGPKQRTNVELTNSMSMYVCACVSICNKCCKYICLK